MTYTASRQSLSFDLDIAINFRTKDTYTYRYIFIYNIWARAGGAERASWTQGHYIEYILFSNWLIALLDKDTRLSSVSCIDHPHWQWCFALSHTNIHIKHK